MARSRQACSSTARRRTGCRRVSYGPWSTRTTPHRAGRPPTTVATPLEAAVGRVSVGRRPLGCTTLCRRSSSRGDGYALHRVYVSTDADCVNVVHVGSIVGGTAYAPRTTGPLALSPETVGSTRRSLVPRRRDRGRRHAALGRRDREDEREPDRRQERVRRRSSVGHGAKGRRRSTSGTATGIAAATTGRSFRFAKSYDDTTVGDRYRRRDGRGSYQDLMLPQDACQAGDVLRRSDGSASSRVSGEPLRRRSPPACRRSGRLLSAASGAAPSTASPLVAWTPARAPRATTSSGAGRAYPWQAAGQHADAGDVGDAAARRPGTWWYRVRGHQPVAARATRR